MFYQIEDYTSIHGPMDTCVVIFFHFKNARNTLEKQALQQMVLVELDVCM